MFNDDEDYGFLTGGLGDLDGDGDVDFIEYMNEEDEKEKGRIERYIDLIDNAYKKAPLGSKP